MLNFCEAGRFILPISGARSRRAAVLTSRILRSELFSGVSSLMEVSVLMVSADGIEKSEMASSNFIEAEAGAEIGFGGTGIGLGAGKGPTDSASSPESPSGIDEGAATGSAKTGSLLVVFVMSSIAFCKSLSAVGFWFICPPLLCYLFLV